MKTYKYLFLLLLMVVLALLAGCSVLQAQMNRTTPTVEASPTPVTLPTQLSLISRVDSQTCQVAELVAIQTDKPQGDLLAWSPTGHALAFVQPVNQYSGFYIGDLAVYNTETREIFFTSKDRAVFGDLTWSPDGSALAFSTLDQTAEVYTIKIVNLSDGNEVDIFGDAARTEDYASQKGILSWTNSTDLVVTSVCGSDCVRVYLYNTVSQVLNPQQDIRYNENTSLTLVNDITSPDGYWQLNIDNKNNTWLTSGGDTYIADKLDNTRLTSNLDSHISLLLANTSLKEWKFSKDSQYLALRTADKVLVYQLGCSAK